MSQEVLSRAFEPFFTTKKQSKGTGLGLASIYGFMWQSGGYVTIYSEVGHGTTVNLYLPRIESGAIPIGAALESKDDFSGRGLILVVEDNSGVRELTVERLKSLGYDVMAATNALVAKAIIAATPYIHLVFSDIVMPGGLSGFDLARWIGEQYPALKVLLTSGFGEEIVHTNGGDQLARLLSKPYSAGELACAIKAALQN